MRTEGGPTRHSDVWPERGGHGVGPGTTRVEGGRGGEGFRRSPLRGRRIISKRKPGPGFDI